MRRLTVLLLAFSLAFLAHSLFVADDSLTGVLSARGLLLYAVAAGAFAWAAGPMPLLRVMGTARGWPLAARIGAAVAVASAAIGALLLIDLPYLALWAFSVGLLTLAVWWPGDRERYKMPPYRWTTDASGRWVRMTLGGDQTTVEADTVPATVPGRDLLLVPLALVLGAAAFLRLWHLGSLPPDCVAAECEAALRLVGADPSYGSVTDLLALFLYRFTADGLYSLRLSGALIGIATLPVFYWAVRPLDRAGGAAYATMLLALAPWHIWASRSSAVMIAAPLLLALCIGAGLRALTSVDRRWWWAAGTAMGVLIVGVAPARNPAFAWATATLALAVWAQATVPITASTRIHNLAAWLAAATVIVLPAAAVARAGNVPPGGLDSITATIGNLVTSVLHGGAGYDYFLVNPLLAVLPATLAILGFGQLVRSAYRPHVAYLIAGTLLYAWFVLRHAGPGMLPGLALTLLPFFFLAAAVSLDTMVLDVWLTWRMLAPARSVLGWALVVVLLAGIWPLQLYWRSLEEMGSVAHRSADDAIGNHILACLAVNTYETCVLGQENAQTSQEYTPVIYAPATALDAPSTRLRLEAASGAGDAQKRLHALDVARDVPPDPLPDGPALYLVSIEEGSTISLLQQFYPEAEMTALPEGDGPAQFVVVAVDRQELLDRQGIEGYYFAGRDFGATQDAAMSLRDGPLAFDWQADPPMPGDFSVLWEGSLHVPAAGAYRFSVELPASKEGDGVAFTLQLDDRLILDTSLGLLAKEEELAHGFYRLAMRYRTPNMDGAPEDWAVRWQLPGEDSAIIPRDALYSPALPDVGLIGTYYAGEDFEGPVLTRRKEFVIGAETDLPMPYSVEWRGKLAAPRAGEYLFAVSSTGSAQMSIDDHEIVMYSSHNTDGDQVPSNGGLSGQLVSGKESPTGGDKPPYIQASIYLPEGWHEFTLRYVPNDGAQYLRILWQPPGSIPTLLPTYYLRPELGQLLAIDATLPAPPPLLDPGLGGDDFALSFVSEDFSPEVVVPPTDLPLFALEEVWYAGGVCGSAVGQFNAPRGVVLDASAGHAIVADTANHRIAILDWDSGAEVGEYTSEEFEEPVDLALGVDGELLVLDAVAHPLFRIDTATGEIAPAAVDTEFYRPRGLHVDDVGDVLVADTGGARAVLLDGQGAVLAQFGGHDTALGAGQPVDVLTQDGVMWAVTAEDGRLWRLYDQSALTALPRQNTVDGPHLASLPGRGFFVSDPVGRTIRFHAASGEPILQFAYSQAFVTPVGIAVAESDGMVYLAVTDSAVCTVSLWRGPVSNFQP
ncbi:MAG: PA14 domain-containing protein [Caldilineaceae bacterium]